MGNNYAIGYESFMKKCVNKNKNVKENPNAAQEQIIRAC